ncbi:hypothetical protein Misp04_52680 [Micromonospora sp. NBRC 101691]|nr:hypothetical protein Misp04_52680 [Micromonospora sp. NBRC 101691]
MRAGGDLLEPHDHGGGLLLAEHQGREGSPWTELVATAGAPRRGDRIPEFLEAVDVTAERALADTEATGEFVAGPVTPVLKQSEEFEDPGAARHDPTLAILVAV